MPKKFSQKEAEERFRKLGFSLLSVYNGMNSEVELLCKNQHTFESTYKKINKNPTCKKCKRNAVLQEINAVLKDNGFELVSEYTGYDDTIFVRCKNNHVVDMLYDNIKKGNKCRKCNNKVLPEYSFMKNYIEEKGYTLLSNKIVSATKKFTVRCPKGHEYDVNWNKFSSGRRCPHCQNKIKLSKEQANEIFMEYGYNIIGEYTDTITPVYVRCPKGHEYPVTVGNFKGGKRCRECKNNFKGEVKIKKYLEQIKEEYETQYKFKGCRNIYELPFDFYISKYNLCIEYDGIQHYKPIEFFGGIEGFKKRKRNDNIKNKYCKDNNINLLRIPYWDIKNIDDKISLKIAELKETSTTISKESRV